MSLSCMLGLVWNFALLCPAALQLTVQGADFIRKHPEYGETFPEWKLYEGARSCYTFLTKKRDLLKDLVEEAQATVDFLNPRLNNSTVLQCLQHCMNCVATTLYEGVDEADLDMLVLEVASFCVTWLAPEIVIAHFTWLMAEVCLCICLFPRFRD